jgi:hypothetical protein
MRRRDRQVEDQALRPAIFTASHSNRLPAPLPACRLSRAETKTIHADIVRHDEDGGRQIVTVGTVNDGAGVALQGGADEPFQAALRMSRVGVAMRKVEGGELSGRHLDPDPSNRSVARRITLRVLSRIARQIASRFAQNRGARRDRAPYAAV